MKKLCLLAVINLFGLFALAGMASAQSVAGEWQATMETPGEPSVSKLTLTQDGEKIAGTIKGRSGEYQLQGTVKGKEVKFSYSTNYNGNAVPITVSGLLDGDTIKGTASIAGGAYEGGWMAKRMGGAAAAPMAKAQSGNGNEWEVTINSPQGASTSTLVYTLEGETLKGQLKNARGGLPVSGMLKGNDITVKFNYKAGDMDMVITLTGKLAGDTAKGEADFGGMAQGEWTGKKLAGGAAATTSAAATAQASNGAVNVTGAWSVEVETQAGSGNPSFTFKQDGEKLTGRYKGQLGEADLTGTVKGGQIEFSFKLTGGQVEGTVVYTGTTDGKTMKGKVRLAELGEGTFTGKKQ